MGRLSHKICMITGAARGIGAAIAEAFSREGATVIVTDKNIAEGQKTADRLATEFYPLDVSNEKDWDTVFNKIQKLDVLVNNAGITGFEDCPRPHNPEHENLKDWRYVHSVNLDGTFLGCRAAIRKMRPTGSGSIINISSRSGLVGIPHAGSYASSKAAVRNHTKSVALYCAEERLNIRCNSIHPGAIMTPMWDEMLGSGAERQASIDTITAEIPLGRFGKAEEVASIAILLASNEATYITGTEFTIDGGMLAGSSASPKKQEKQ